MSHCRTQYVVLAPAHTPLHTHTITRAQAHQRSWPGTEAGTSSTQPFSRRYRTQSFLEKWPKVTERDAFNGRAEAGFGKTSRLLGKTSQAITGEV